MTTEDTSKFISNLSRDSRVLKQARVLPMAKLTDELVAKVRADFVAYTSRLGIFNDTVAKETGLSPSVISQFHNASYKGDNDRVARLINSWMEDDARRRQTALPSSYISTRLCEEMRAVIELACASCSMLAISAPAGSGKTMLLELLAERYRGRYLYCTEDMTPRSFLIAIANVLDVRAGNRNKHDLTDQICDKLKGTRRPLFFDECHRLPVECLSRIRTINDRAGVPIIMAGTQLIIERTQADRNSGNGQFGSRSLVYNALDSTYNEEDNGPGKKAGRPLFTRQEIRAFLESMNVRYDRDAFELLFGVAGLPAHGCLRMVRRLVLLVRPDESRRQELITRRELEVGLQLTFGAFGVSLLPLADSHARRFVEAA